MSSELKGLALQIAAQLPPDRQTALKVLAFAKEIVEWRAAAEDKQPAAVAVLPPRSA